MLLGGLDAKFEFDIKAGIVAGAGGLSAGLPLTEATLIGLGVAAVPSFSLKKSVGLKRAKQPTTPFEYVSRYHRELF